MLHNSNVIVPSSFSVAWWKYALYQVLSNYFYYCCCCCCCCYYYYYYYYYYWSLSSRL